MTKDVLAACPALKQPLQQLLDAAMQLVGQGLDTSALAGMQFVRPSSQEQLCPELPQIAHYLPGMGVGRAAVGLPGGVCGVGVWTAVGAVATDARSWGGPQSG